MRTVAVYRHGCLAGTYPGAEARDRTYESWSTAKTVVSLAAGRAMEPHVHLVDTVEEAVQVVRETLSRRGDG